MKAFYQPSRPFPILHIDTTWKFREMIEFRDRMAAALGFDLLVHTNPEGVAEGINPFDHGSNTYTHVMKTVALRQALDGVWLRRGLRRGAARREKSRAKERIFSFRNQVHSWDPKSATTAKRPLKEPPGFEAGVLRPLRTPSTNRLMVISSGMFGTM